MRKTAVCLLAAAFMLSVSGCGNSDSSSTAGQEAEYQQNGTADSVEQENIGSEQNENSITFFTVLTPSVQT